MSDTAKAQEILESDCYVGYVSFFRHGDSWHASLSKNPTSGSDCWKIVLPVPRALRKDPLPGTVTLGPQHQV